MAERTDVSPGGADREKPRRADTALQDCAAYRRNIRTEQYEYVSPLIEGVTGFSADEMCAMSLDAFLARVHPEDALKMVFEFERIGHGGRTVIEYRFKHKDGEYRRVADHAEVLTEADGQTVHRVGFFRVIGPQEHAHEATTTREGAGPPPLPEQTTDPSTRSLLPSAGASRRRISALKRLMGVSIGIGALAVVLEIIELFGPAMLPARIKAAPTAIQLHALAPAAESPAANSFLTSTARDLRSQLDMLTSQVAMLQSRASRLEQQISTLTKHTETRAAGVQNERQEPVVLLPPSMLVDAISRQHAVEIEAVRQDGWQSRPHESAVASSVIVTPEWVRGHKPWAWRTRQSIAPDPPSSSR